MFSSACLGGLKHKSTKGHLAAVLRPDPPGSLQCFQTT